jgi:hypothetical protein
VRSGVDMECMPLPETLYECRAGDAEIPIVQKISTIRNCFRIDCGCYIEGLLYVSCCKCVLRMRLLVALGIGAFL